MSSTGAVSTRGVDPTGQEQFQKIASDVSAAATAERASATNGTLSLDTAVRVERLLGQLEVQSMALALYRKATPEDRPSKPSIGVLIGTLVALSLTILALAVLYIVSEARSTQLVEGVPTPQSLVIPSVPDHSAGRAAELFDQLTRELIGISSRIGHVETELQKSNYDFSHTRARPNAKLPAATRSEGATHAETTAPAVAPSVASIAIPATTRLTFGIAPLVPTSAPAVPATAHAILEAPSVPFPSTAAVQPPVTASVPKGPVIKNQYEVLKTRPTLAAKEHKDVFGNIDYWTVPRPGQQGTVNVVPIDLSADGVVVRNLEDGKNYTLTPQGEWRKAEW